MKTRFITYEIISHNTVYAKTESEYKAEGIPEDWDDFVWQFAPDKETAIRQHADKVDDWRNDLNHGREPKATY